jgi:AcrR family transcriptional regulator
MEANLQNKPYHHGNLEQRLIEVGISLINTEGFENFSLRKVAAKCGVSHTAPYKHFPNKEAMLQAMQKYLTDAFSDFQEKVLSYHENDPELMIFLGKAYLEFFLENPHYFRFLMSNSGAEINLSHMNVDSGYRPFEIFKNAALKHMKRFEVPKAFQCQTLISMWAMVHGLTALATMNGVQYEGNWSKLLESILKKNATDGGRKHEE